VEDLTLQAAKRNILRKKTRFLRRQGITPTHLFGHSIKSLALQCDTLQLKHIIARAGMTRPINLEVEDDKRPKSVFIREIQSNPISKQLIHVDFYQVRKGEKIKIEVPVVLIGEAPAMKGKGRMITHGITSLSIECLPENLPSQIEVDLSPLEEVNQAIHVRDIVFSPDITVHADPDQLLVKVSEVMIKEVEEVPVEVEAGAEAEEVEAPAAEEKVEEQHSK